jgi:hypothetical protein
MKLNLEDIDIEGLDSDEWIRLKSEERAREEEEIARAIDEAEAADLDERKKTSKAKDNSGYYIFTDIPGAGKGWTLAVFAIHRRDAGEYIKNVHRGGRFVYSVIGGGTVNATCGAVTDRGRDKIRENNRKKGIF